MSNRALNWAFDSGLPSGQRFVLVVLADHAGNHSGEDWTCFPAVETLVDMTGMGRSTVERHLSWLWAEGWISREPRVRADGTLGINDYVLHRLPERRAVLKEERARMEKLPGRRRSGGDDPSLKSRDGPSLKSRVSNPQIEGWTPSEPSLKSRGQEPPSEPSDEPTTRVREPGDDGFDEVATLWPLKGRKFTRWPAARAAWAKARQVESVERLQAAIAACARDPDRAKGDFGWPGLDVFLRDEIWRGYLPGAAEAAAPQPALRTRFAGPPELRAAIVAAATEDFAAAYLDRASFDGEAVRPATGEAFKKLRDPSLAAVFQRCGVRLVAPVIGGRG